MIDIDEPTLYRAVSIPEAFLETETSEGESGRYGGDVRIGDLTGDGRPDFLIYRSVDNGVTPSYIAAFSMDGDPLWEHGPGGSQPSRPGPVALYDIDGDGRDEVLCFFHDEDAPDTDTMADVVVQIRDGTTGTVRLQSHPDVFDDIGSEGPNWVHQRLLVATFRDTDRPRDFVVKLGNDVLAFDDRLTVQWQYHIPDTWTEYGDHTAYIPAIGDIDGDGRDEVNGGKYLLDHDGTPLWERDLARHMDSVAITEWDGTARAICSGYGHVMDNRGEVILSLGEDAVPHGQEVRVADFLADREAPEMLLRYDGHSPDVMLVDQGGAVVNRFELNPTPNNTGMTPVYWHGPDEAALVCNGGMIWTGDGGSQAAFPELPDPVGSHRMAWYHCIPANVCGDEREEVVLYNPCDRRIYVYTPAPFDAGAFGGYEPTERQYNARLMD